MPLAVFNLQGACDSSFYRPISPVPTDEQTVPPFGHLQGKLGACLRCLRCRRRERLSRRMEPQYIYESTSTDSCQDGQHYGEPRRCGPRESTTSFPVPRRPYFSQRLQGGRCFRVPKDYSVSVDTLFRKPRRIELQARTRVNRCAHSQFYGSDSRHAGTDALRGATKILVG